MFVFAFGRRRPFYCNTYKSRVKRISVRGNLRIFSREASVKEYTFLREHVSRSLFSLMYKSIRVISIIR